MRRERIGQSLDRRLGGDPHHARVDQLGGLGADDHDPQQLAVAGLVDGLHPAGRLAGHLRSSRRRERKLPDLDVIAVELSGLGLGETDGRDLGIRVGATRDRRVVDRGIVTERVLGRDLAFPK